MKKAVSWMLSVVLVLSMALSFSVPVEAASSVDLLVSKVPGRSIFYGAVVPDPANSNQYILPVTVAFRLKGLNFTPDPGYTTFKYSFSTGISVRYESYGGLTVTSSGSYPFTAVGPSDIPSLDYLTPLASSGFLYDFTPGYHYFWYVSTFEVTVKTNSSYYPEAKNFSMSVVAGRISYDLLRSASQDASSFDVSDQTAALEKATQQQTDTLTNGYDNSGMNSDNDRLSASLSGYDEAEGQVTDQSVEYIDAVTFFDPTTHLQLMTCVTWTSTFLQNLFVALGDWSVLVMIALSLAFALMLVGWFKYRK